MVTTALPVASVVTAIEAWPGPVELPDRPLRVRVPAGALAVTVSEASERTAAAPTRWAVSEGGAWWIEGERLETLKVLEVLDSAFGHSPAKKPAPFGLPRP